MTRHLTHTTPKHSLLNSLRRPLTCLELVFRDSPIPFNSTKIHCDRVIHHASPDDFSSIEPWHSFGRPPRTGRRAAGLAGWLCGASHQKDGPRHIRRHRVGADGTLSGGEVFAECTAGLFKGFSLDREGRIRTSARDGVHCDAPDRLLPGKVLIPEFVAKVCFRGAKLDRLFICGTTSLYAVMTHTNGATRPT